MDLPNIKMTSNLMGCGFVQIRIFWSDLVKKKGWSGIDFCISSDGDLFFLKGWIRIWSGSVKSQPSLAILVYKLRNTKRYLRLTGLYRYSNYLPAEDDFADTSSAPVSFNVKREDSAAPFFVTVDGQVKLCLVYSWVHSFEICEKKNTKKTFENVQ